MRNGAHDVFSRPVDEHRFLLTLIRALERKILMEALNLPMEINSDLMEPDAFNEIVSKDPQMKVIFHYMERVAKSRHPVLITGETGVGKELIARALYKLSGREPFVSVNIASVDDLVFSDTLFGHRKGAFTGADTARDGLLAKAGDGILFLDEIGDLPNISQVKLLGLIQDSLYYPLGSDVQSRSDAKLVMATNVDIENHIREGKFRKDLYYRIRTHHVHVPPLRERLGDIPALVYHFADQAAKSLGKKTPVILPELITLLSCYDYPGNVRELQAMINDAVAQHKRGALSMGTFQDKIRLSRNNRKATLNKTPDDGEGLKVNFSKFPTLKEWEDYLVRMAVEKSNNNQGIAADLLGISRQALNKRLLKKKNDK
jgi:DNA-binding NtrC family response regulator